MSTFIRPAEINDASALAEVHVRTWQHAYRGQIPDAVLDALSVERRAGQWRTWLSEQVEGTSVSVAVENEAVVGFCWVGRSRDEDATDTTGELLAIYVLPQHQGLGIGRSLMADGVDRLKAAGFQDAILWVLESNSSARGFYERYGWIADGAVKSEQVGETPVTEDRYQIELSVDA
jgi:ribosomal protein S18 acetylase RimI-like enzyme